MDHDLKALALAAVEARKALDAGAYSSSGRELAHAKIKEFETAATPERILQYRNEVLEEAAKVAETAGSYPVGGGDGGTRTIGTALNAAVAIRSLKTPEPT